MKPKDKLKSPLKVHKFSELVAMVAITILLSGCIMGSYATRMEDKRPNCSFTGKYPYAAVAWDVKELKTIGGSKIGEFGEFALISIPLDLIIDTIMTPVDLVAWPFGFSKGNL